MILIEMLMWVSRHYLIFLTAHGDSSREKPLSFYAVDSFCATGKRVIGCLGCWDCYYYHSSSSLQFALKHKSIFLFRLKSEASPRGRSAITVFDGRANSWRNENGCELGESIWLIYIPLLINQLPCLQYYQSVRRLKNWHTNKQKTEHSQN